MIITRTPFRISFAGGGSDLEVFHSKEPGAVLSTAIDKYMYLTVKERFGDSFRVSYSQTELVDRVDQISHPIVRECLNCTRHQDRAGDRLGGRLARPKRDGIVQQFHRGPAARSARAQRTCRHRQSDWPNKLATSRSIVLKEPIGKQDQYIAAYGGLKFIQFQPDGNVFVDPVPCCRGTWEELNRRLLLFFTGKTRRASKVLQKQRSNTEASSARSAASVRDRARNARHPVGGK